MQAGQGIGLVGYKWGSIGLLPRTGGMRLGLGAGLAGWRWDCGPRHISVWVAASSTLRLTVHRQARPLLLQTACAAPARCPSWQPCAGAVKGGWQCRAMPGVLLMCLGL